MLEIPVDKFRSRDILEEESFESDINTDDLLEALASSSLQNIVERSTIVPNPRVSAQFSRND